MKRKTTGGQAGTKGGVNSGHTIQVSVGHSSVTQLATLVTLLVCGFIGFLVYRMYSGKAAEPVAPKDDTTSAAPVTSGNTRPPSKDATETPAGSGATADSSPSGDGELFRIGSGEGGGKSEKMAGTQMRSVKHSIADDIAEQAKKIKKDLDQVPSENMKARVERAEASAELADELKRVKHNLPGSGENMIADLVEGSRYVPGNPYPKNPVVPGGGRSPKPMDLFTDPRVDAMTRPNIDFTGYGAPQVASTSVIEPKPKIVRSDLGVDFTYKNKPSAMAKPGETIKTLASRGPTVLNFDQVKALHEKIADARSRAGFMDALGMGPRFLERRAQHPHSSAIKEHPARYLSPSRSERAIGNELGTTDHSFDSSNNVESGLTQKNAGGGGGAVAPPMGNSRSSANHKKAQVKESLMRILVLFDRVFHEELFPDAVVDKQGDGTVYIRDGKEGKCILLNRYYEYVESSVKATLGLGKTGPLTWAKNVDLSFESIGKNKLALQTALVQTCSADGAYKVDRGEMKTSQGEAITVSIPWPADNSVLLSHPMKFGTR